MVEKKMEKWWWEKVQMQRWWKVQVLKQVLQQLVCRMERLEPCLRVQVPLMGSLTH